MGRGNSQTGSLHVVIFAIIFVIVMGALGAVFYMNFIAPKPEVVEEQKAPETNLTSTRVPFVNDHYNLDYPKDWTSVTADNNKQTGNGTITKITNPEGTVQASFKVSESGTRSTCDINDGLDISYYEIDSTPNTTLSEQPVYLVQTMFDRIGGGYDYMIGLTPDGGETHASVGESRCNVINVGVTSLLILDEKKLVKPTVVAKIEFPKIPRTQSGAVKDMQTIKNLMKTDDYAAAVAVLKSARKE